MRRAGALPSQLGREPGLTETRAGRVAQAGAERHRGGIRRKDAGPSGEKAGDRGRLARTGGTIPKRQGKVRKTLGRRLTGTCGTSPGQQAAGFRARGRDPDRGGLRAGLGRVPGRFRAGGRPRAGNRGDQRTQVTRVPIRPCTGEPEVFRKHGQAARQHQEMWLERLGQGGSEDPGPDGRVFRRAGRPDQFPVDRHSRPLDGNPPTSRGHHRKFPRRHALVPVEHAGWRAERRRT